MNNLWCHPYCVEFDRGQFSIRDESSLNYRPLLLEAWESLGHIVAKNAQGHVRVFAGLNEAIAWAAPGFTGMPNTEGGT